jgi:hypothetical protein
MKLNEILEEDRTDWPEVSVHALPNAKHWAELDNSSPYKAYRFGLALASAPHQNMAAEGPTAQHMVTVGYTPEETAMAAAAAKIIGVSSSNLTGEGSTEHPDTHAKSPVPHNSGAPRKKRA